MAHLTKPNRYDIEDSNIALLGSDIEKRVREHAGDKEAVWTEAGQQPGVQIWRIEQFHVKSWPKDKYGVFYDGDSYIVLYTYKKTKDSEALSYNLHFWLGENTSQDEAGTAAYKTVELDDHLHGIPVQYREVQNEESSLFTSYFKQFHVLQGGVATGFHHVTQPPEDSAHRLFVIKSSVHHSVNMVVYQLPLEGKSLLAGTVFVLDKGTAIWQFNKESSHGKERFKAAEFAKSLADTRKGHSEVKVFEEHGQGGGIFLAELNLEAVPSSTALVGSAPALLQITRAGGGVEFTPLPSPPRKDALQSSGMFLLDATGDLHSPAVYVWVGNSADPADRRHAVQLAQDYLHRKQGAKKTASIVRVDEGRESASFLHVLEAH